MVKENAHVLSVFITQQFNKSLTHGVFPDAFKRTIVNPILKKIVLDGQDLKNYRLVSNLSYLSKLLEKVVHIQISK